MYNNKIKYDKFAWNDIIENSSPRQLTKAVVVKQHA